MEKMDREFYARDAKQVAWELLGKIIVRKIKDRKLKARIVETEAYYGEKDPASRACKNGNLKKVMRDEPGKLLVYGVHNNWLINFVTGKKGKAQAVLLRAIEPLNFQAKTSGPGLLTRALKINKSFHNKYICNCQELKVEEANDNFDKLANFEIASSKRIGVKQDLPKKLRFYIKDSKFVSRR